MHPDTPPAPPRAQPDLVTALRTDLNRAEYTVATTESLLGDVASGALRRENPVPARRVLAGRAEPAGVLLDLFTLGACLPRSRVEAVLPTLTVDGALELGLLAPARVGPAPTDPGDIDPGVVGPGDIGAGVDHMADDPDPLLRATLDLAPYAATDDTGEITWWIASDLSEVATGAPLGPEHVLGVGGASLTLARITPRTRVGRVLDVGCGGGIQALHASRHADHVVATDLSERALAFAAFNAALNDIEIELRQGSLLEPAHGERFDLIVSNPPFVITPRDRDEQGTWTYRDGGRAGDALLEELLRHLPQHLLPGGRVVMLGNWEISEADVADVADVADDSWDAHPRRWLEPALAAGADCWVIQRESEDPAQYAETWVRDGGLTDRDPRWPELIGAWLEDFAGRDVDRIGFGYLLLRRPEPAAGRRGTLRTEQVLGTGSGTLSEHITDTLRMQRTLAELDDDTLGGSRPIRSADVIERRHLTPGEFDPLLIELVQGAGFARVVPADQVLAATVGALDDGTLTLDQTLAAVCALTDHDLEQTRQRVLPQIRELILTGMVAL